MLAPKLWQILEIFNPSLHHFLTLRLTRQSHKNCTLSYSQLLQGSNFFKGKRYLKSRTNIVMQFSNKLSVQIPSQWANILTSIGDSQYQYINFLTLCYTKQVNENCTKLHQPLQMENRLQAQNKHMKYIKFPLGILNPSLLHFLKSCNTEQFHKNCTQR